MASALLSIKERDKGKSRARIRARGRERNQGPTIFIGACVQ